jgi:hypothetical protein
VGRSEGESLLDFVESMLVKEKASRDRNNSPLSVEDVRIRSKWTGVGWHGDLQSF